MQEFIHHKIKIIDKLFLKFNHVQRLFNEKSFDFDAQLNEFLKDLLEYFHSRGEQTHEAEILNFIGRIQTIKRGFNPVKMQKIETGKRELFWGFAFTIHEAILEILSKLHNTEQQKLDEGEAIISNLILNLYQNHILTDEKIAELNSVQKIEVYWNFLLTQNGSISSIDKKLKMSLIAEDIYLLFEKSLLKIA